MSIESKNVTLKIYRFNAETDYLPYYETYEMEITHEDVVLDVLNRLKWEHTGSLSYRRSCRHGICGSCSIKVNNKAVLACKERMWNMIDLFGTEMTFKPLSEKRVVKDFIIDKKDFWDKHDAVRPYLEGHIEEHPEMECVVTPEENERFMESDLCIQCGNCHYSCPAVEENEMFYGPAAFVKAYRFAADVRDDYTKERLEYANQPGKGVWDCMKCFECVEACPKEINPLEKITKLHNMYFEAGIAKSNVGTRHAVGFSHLKSHGLLDEAALVVYSERLGVVKNIPAALSMLKAGKLPMPWAMPKSKNLDEIKTLLKTSSTVKF